MEQWRTLEDYPQYAVNEHGDVMRTNDGLILKYRFYRGQEMTSLGPKDARRGVSRQTAMRAYETGSIESAIPNVHERSKKASEAGRAVQQAKKNATHERIIEAWNRGLNAKQIREELGLGENTVLRHLRAAGLSAKERIRNKEAEARAEKELERLKAKAFRDMKGEQLKLFPKVCTVCGTPIVRGKKCPECSAHVFSYDHDALVCCDCGETFKAENKNGMGPKPKRCPTCQKKHRKRNKYPSDYGTELNTRGRHATRKTGAKYEPVNPDKIFERDGGVCYLCHRPTKERDGVWSPDYPTCDHVVPLSKGGDHTYENIRLACWACNTAKGAELLTGDLAS